MSEAAFEQTRIRERRPYSLGEEIANSVIHGVGVALSIAALVMLIVFAVVSMAYDVAIGAPRDVEDLQWFVGWRPLVWSRALRRVVGDPARFRGRRLLELGFRSGRMACYFAMLGAEVHAVDLPDCCLAPARELAARLGVSDRVTFANYDGDLDRLPQGQWDFVFTKSVLVVLPLQEAVPAIRRLLRPGGQYLGCENASLPLGLNRLRYPQAGINGDLRQLFARHFTQVRMTRTLGVVISIVAAA